MLDALLMAAVARRDGLPPALTADDVLPIEIPIEREPGGRFYLCTTAQFTTERAELQHTNSRAPVEQYSTIGNDKIKRVQITAGVNKSFRKPRAVSHLVDDTMHWWCVGDGEQIRALLGLCTHLGHKRSVGLGKVANWTVEPCDPWPGFPVVRDGDSLRPLPTDWPGATEPTGYRCLLPPYWRRTEEQLCVIPRIQ